MKDEKKILETMLKSVGTACLMTILKTMPEYENMGDIELQAKAEAIVGDVDIIKAITEKPE